MLNVFTGFGTSRRSFLKGGAAAATGLVLGFHLPTGRKLGARAAETSGVFPPNAFIHITPDNTVTITCKHLEHGMGIRTGIATIIAEELDADWSRIYVEPAPANAELYKNLQFNSQSTGGSNSIRNSYEQHRQIGAAARAMLVAAAASRWGVEANQITVERGVVMHPASGRRASFGELAEAAAAQPVPTEVTFKDPARFTLIGRDDGTIKRLDSPAKVTATAQFGIDVTLPGMLVAVVAHPRQFGATVKSFDATEVRKVTGVLDVVPIPTGVAVLANSFWSAIKGRDALRVVWDDSKAEKRGTPELLAEHRALLDQPGLVARKDGDAEAALARAAKVVSATYEFPILAHAPLEPVACVVRLSKGRCEIWTGDAAVTNVQNGAAQTLGLKPEQVEIHSVYAGGHFGRRSATALEAVEIAKAIGGRAPVKLQWTRPEELQNSEYRPMYLHKATAGIDGDGNIIAWHHRIVGQSLLGNNPEFAAMFTVNGVDLTSVAGIATTPYDIPNILVECHNTEVGLPISTWRGNYHMAYAMETFLDEVAHAAGRDPFELRRTLLARDVRQKKIDVLAIPELFLPDIFAKHPRELRALEIAAERAGWGTPLEPGRGRGIAVAFAYATPLAQVAEVTVAPDGSFKLDRVVCTLDCGVAINPDIIRAQIAGGIAFGLGAVLHSEITLKDGTVEQSNFDDFQVLRIEEMPPVEVYIMPSSEPPTGVGEPGVVPIGAAVANAVFAATGRMFHKLPFDRA
jgi:isoquinoline 1-oxidoreductase beta subunit